VDFIFRGDGRGLEKISSFLTVMRISLGIAGPYPVLYSYPS
jgi:hypothetical protein